MFNQKRYDAQDEFLRVLCKHVPDLKARSEIVGLFYKCDQLSVEFGIKIARDNFFDNLVKDICLIPEVEDDFNV